MDQKKLQALLKEREDYIVEQLEEAEKQKVEVSDFLLCAIAHHLLRIETYMEFLCSKHD